MIDPVFPPLLLLLSLLLSTQLLSRADVNAQGPAHVLIAYSSKQ
jgi:hypothetical protein